MLANFFEKSKPNTFLVLISLFVMYFLCALFNGFPLDLYLEKSFFSYLCYGILIALTFLLFNFIVFKNNLTFDNSFAFLFLVICLGLLPLSFLNAKTLLVHTILLLFFRKIYSLQSLKSIFKKLFDAGLGLGVAFVLEPFTVLFAILLYVAIYLHLKITFQTLLIPVIGFVAFPFLYFTYCFWFNQSHSFIQLFTWDAAYSFVAFQNLFFPLLMIGVFLVFSVIVKTPKVMRISNQFRRSWILLLNHFLLALIFIFLLKNKNGSELLFLLFPTAIILANGLELLPKKWLKNGIIIVFVISGFLIAGR